VNQAALATKADQVSSERLTKLTIKDRKQSRGFAHPASERINRAIAWLKGHVYPGPEINWCKQFNKHKHSSMRQGLCGTVFESHSSLFLPYE
jgi:hypothetical protein